MREIGQIDDKSQEEIELTQKAQKVREQLIPYYPSLKIVLIKHILRQWLITQTLPTDHLSQDIISIYETEL